MTNQITKIKDLTKKPIGKIITVILVLLIIVSVGLNILNKEDKENEEIITAAREVKTIILNKALNNPATISAVGRVKAESTIDIVAMAKGAVRSLSFEVGDEVKSGKTLVSLNDSSVYTNLFNAQNYYNNIDTSLNTTKRITEESIRQAELGVESAEKTVEAAKISLKTAGDNLFNSKSLTDKSGIDTKNNAVISFGGHLNTIFIALDRINNLLKIDNGGGFTSLDPSIAAENPETLKNARANYKLADSNYNTLNDLQVNSDNIKTFMPEAANTLAFTKEAVDAVINVLENTVTGSYYTGTALASEKTGFTSLRSTIVGAQTAAEATIQSLENIGLQTTSQISALENAIEQSKNQLASAETGLKNAKTALNNSKLRKEQEVLSAQISLDNAKNSLSLVQIQASDLSVSAPIDGVIVEKFVETGMEINPGQIIARISKTDMLIIETDFPAIEVIKIKQGQEAIINNDLSGTINRIYPTADPSSKKVKVEIVYDNKDNTLIPESFVDVSVVLGSDEEDEESGLSVLYVPIKAVTISPNEKYVFIVKGNKAKKIIVELGKTEADLIEIMSGLKNGDEVIIEGNKVLEPEEEVIVNN